MKLMVIIGSVREGRRADIVANWALQQLRQDTELEIDVADLKDIALPFFNEAIIPSDNKGRYENTVGQAWADRVAAADAFIMITAEYNHGPPASLKNAIDWVYDGWKDKPVGFISYGGISGGIRAVLQLRQNVANAGLWPIPGNVHIPFVSKAFDENGQPNNPGPGNSLGNMLPALKSLQRKLKS